MIDDFGQTLSALNEIARRELAFENAILKMITESLHCFEDLSKTFVIGDIVANDVSRSHILTIVSFLATCKKKETNQIIKEQ